MIEGLIIAVLVIWSSIVVFKSVMPKTANKTFSHLAMQCEKLGWTGVANYLAPKKSSGCGGGCGCDTPDEKKIQSEAVKAVKWK